MNWELLSLSKLLSLRGELYLKQKVTTLWFYGQLLTGLCLYMVEKITYLLRPSIRLSVRPSVHPSLSPSVRPSIIQSIRLSVSPSVRLSVCPSVRPSFRLTVRPSIHPYILPSICLTIRPSVCLSIHPSVCLSVCLSVRPWVCACLQIRYSAENGWHKPNRFGQFDMNREAKILRKKYISKINIVKNMKLMILSKIRVIHICSSSPRAASVHFKYSIPVLQCEFTFWI